MATSGLPTMVSQEGKRRWWIHWGFQLNCDGDYNYYRDGDDYTARVTTTPMTRTTEGWRIVYNANTVHNLWFFYVLLNAAEFFVILGYGYDSNARGLWWSSTPMVIVRGICLSEQEREWFSIIKTVYKHFIQRSTLNIHCYESLCHIIMPHYP